uniref:Uncharacterized protein n=1 Tax=Plectus sambesii TaxID=2011161 RepID=A0A914USA9_9BILA
MDVLRQEMRDFGVSVHIMEPGFFRNTGLLDLNAIKSKQMALWKRQSDDVKREYGETFFKDWCKVQEQLITEIGNPNPQIVADAYFQLITSRFPRRRVSVGHDSTYFWIPLSMLPTCIQDYVFIGLGMLKGKPKIAAMQ